MTDSEETKRISYGGLRADEHDVLTDQGWLNISEVTMDSRVATLNSETNHIEYQNPLIVTEYDVDDEMYEVENRIISQCVTKNHGMFVSRRSSKNKKDIYLPYELMEPTKIHNKKRLKYKTNGININPDIDSYSFGKTTVSMDLWLQYLGIWVSDGYLSKDGVQINVSRPRKIKFITNVLNAIGVKYKSYTYKYEDREPRTYIRVTDHDWRQEFAFLSVGTENKYLPEYVWKLSQRQSEILLNSLIEGDGTKDGNSIKFKTSSKRLVDDFQRLCIYSGYSGNSRLTNEAGYTHEIRGKEVTMKYDSYTISVIKKMCQPAIHDGKKEESTIDRFIHYNGKVVYIQVPNFTLFVRRNGKEMELWSLEAHGAEAFTYEKFSQDSDGFRMWICRRCGHHAVYNQRDQIYTCKRCKDFADISIVESTRASVVFQQELAGSNIKVKLGLKPREFEVLE